MSALELLRRDLIAAVRPLVEAQVCATIATPDQLRTALSILVDLPAVIARAEKHCHKAVCDSETVTGTNLTRLLRESVEQLNGEKA